MDKNKECSVIKDLIPLYKDGALSELSEEAVEEHIEKCDPCREYKEFIFNDSPKVESIDNNIPEFEKVETQNYKSIAKKLKRRRIRNTIVAVFSTVLVIVLFNSTFTLYTVPTESMKPTVEIGDRCFINKMAYKFSEPKEGDLVYLLRDRTGLDFEFKDVARVIGIPGDRIFIKDGVLYVNDEPKYKDIYKNISYAGIAQTEFIVPDGKYFVMGDNVNISLDSRHEEYGCADEKEILGKVWFK